jgi:hypothetical protein
MRAKIIGGKKTVQGSNFKLLVGIYDVSELNTHPVPHVFVGTANAVTGYFPAANAAATGYAVTGFNQVGSNILEIDMLPTDTNNILAGEYFDFEMHWSDFGGTQTLIAQCLGQLTVEAQLF